MAGLGQSVDGAVASEAPFAVENVDIRKLPIGPAEAFVLSRIDGRAGVHEIALTTGFSAEQVSTALDLLASLGAVNWNGAGNSSKSGANKADKPERNALGVVTSEPTKPALAARAADPWTRIEELSAAMGKVTHYELFGISRDASKAQIKEAYFALVADVHPDRFFGRDLGDKKPKLEGLFKYLTEAHDVLTRGRRRAEYDATLPALAPEPPLAPEQLRAPEQPPAPGVAVAPAPAVEAARERAPAAPRDDGAPPRSEPVAIPKAPPLIREARPLRVSVTDQRAVSPAEPSARADVSARPAARVSNPQVRVTDAPVSSTPMPRTPRFPRASLRPSLPPVSMRAGMISPAQRYLDAAAVAETEGNLTSALNSLRIALSLCPSDEPLKQRMQQLESRIDSNQSEKLLNDAREAMGRGDPATAARLFGRVARATRSVDHFRRGAECAFEAKQFQLAAELAKRALELSEKTPQLHVLLGKIYVSAEMRSSARAEFQRALDLAPDDQNVKDWLKRIERGDV